VFALPGQISFKSRPIVVQDHLEGDGADLPAPARQRPALDPQLLELKGQVAELAPKATALDRIATENGSLCITDAAKAMQIRPKLLFDFMRSRQWIYRRTGGGDLRANRHNRWTSALSRVKRICSA
jgi:Phage antirepressor protein KilAC domain